MALKINEVQEKMHQSSYPHRFLMAPPGDEAILAPTNHCPQNYSFPNVLQMGLAIMGKSRGQRLVGDPESPWVLSQDYLRAMGASGIIFGFPGADIDYDLRKVELSFLDAGYDYTLQETGSDLRRQVCTTLIKGFPVILYGKRGLWDSVLVTGYKEHGSLLIVQKPAVNGESLFGCCEYLASGWENAWGGAILFGRKLERIHPRLIYTAALENGIEIMARNRWAYSHWILDSTNRIEFQKQDGNHSPENFREWVGEIAEARWYAAHYLNDAAEYLPENRDRLYVASISCEREHGLMWQVEGLVRNKAAREAVSELLGQAEKTYHHTWKHLEKVCHALTSTESCSIQVPEECVNS